MSSADFTYSEPTIARARREAAIEADITTPETVGWESIGVARTPEGGLRVSNRSEAFTIPAPLVPVVLAEIDRIMSGDDETPFEPAPASVHVANASTGAVLAGAAS